MLTALSLTSHSQFRSRIKKALELRARGEEARFAMYCRGLKSLYRKERKLFLVDETEHHITFTLVHPSSKFVYARHLHRDINRPPLKLVLPPKLSPTGTDLM